MMNFEDEVFNIDFGGENINKNKGVDLFSCAFFVFEANFCFFGVKRIFF